MNQFVILSGPKFKEGGCPNSNEKSVDKGEIVVEDISDFNCRTALIIGPIGTCLVTTELEYSLLV